MKIWPSEIKGLDTYFENFAGRRLRKHEIFLKNYHIR